MSTRDLVKQMAELAERQQQLMEQLARRETRVEGISLPHFSGEIGESVDLYFDQVMRYLEAKNIKWEDPANGPRIVAMMSANFRGNAAAWYMLNRDNVHDIQDLMHMLTNEFVPRDNQRRLRDQLYQLRQNRCKSLEDYIGRFRMLLTQVKDMSDLDKITYFTRGLIPQLGREVEYRQCGTMSECFAVALEYDRAHFGGTFNHQHRSPARFSQPPRYHQRPNQFAMNSRPFQQRHMGPEPMEIDNAQVRYNPQPSYPPRKVCAYCKKAGHHINDCYKKKNNDARNQRSGSPSSQPWRRSSINYFEPEEVAVTDDTHDAEANNLEVVVDPTPSAPDESVVEVNNTTHNHVDHGEHELVRVPAKCNGNDVVVMFDSGATDNIVKPGTLDHLSTLTSVKVKRFDGTTTAKQETKRGEVALEIGGRSFTVNVIEWTMSEAQDMILGKPFYHRFNPQINYRTHQISFDGDNAKISPVGIEPTPAPPRNTLQTTEPNQGTGWQRNVKGAQLQNSVATTPKDSTDFASAPPIEVSTSEFGRNLKQQKYDEVYRVKVCSADTQSARLPTQIETLISKYQEVFPEALPNGLPPHRRVEFELTMKPDAKPSNRPPFRLSKTEQDALDEFVEEKLKKGWIEVSDSPWVSNVFGIPKKDPQTGKQPSRSEWIRSGNATLPIRWVIDYRYVNSQTVVPRIPLPRMEELFDKMQGSTVFSVLDLAQGYHQMRISPESRKYTAFRTHTETYQWCVAPMGLAGMPGVWSRLMRVLFGKYPFIVVYLDDICVFSRTMEDHLQHLDTLFQVLRQEKLYAQVTKCHFGATSVNFLGHTISAQGIMVDTKKTEAIAKWPVPTNTKELQSFLGLAGYYRRFICNFAVLALPLSALVKKDAKWEWNKTQDDAFRALKDALQSAPVLKLPDFEREFIVTTDSSGHCVGGVLSQKYGTNDHPIAFYSKKLGNHELNWPTHEKELFAIKMGLEKWRHYLYGRPFVLFTDNSACSWLLHHPKVSAKLARYLTFFAQFNFQIHHVSGSLNTVADALSRQPADVGSIQFHRCSDKCRTHAAAFRASFRDTPMAQQILGGELGPQIHSATTVSHSFIKLGHSGRMSFVKSYESDGDIQEGLNSHKFEKIDGLVYLRTQNKVLRLCVPSDYKLRTNIISSLHDSDIAAHPGVRRTFLRVAQWYYWRNMEKDIHDYVTSCETCARWKHSNAKKNGKLVPIPIPTECWEVVSMDFITGLPESKGFDSILTVVDKLSKRPKYIAVKTTDDAEQIARAFFDNVVRHHGIPAVIISDRDPKFTSNFWRSLAKVMGIKLNMTTAHRAQADGQTERQNLILEDALRCMTSYHGQDWADKLQTIEYAHSTLTSASTGLSPFTIDTGRKERLPIGLPPVRTANQGKTPIDIAEFAKTFHEERQKLLDQARVQLRHAQETQKRYYDQKRSQVEFKAGELVMIDTRRLPLRHAAQDMEVKRAKLAARKIGPFKIERMIGENVAKLRLPASMQKMNPTFNVDILFHSVKDHDRFRNRPIPKTSRVVLDEETGEERYLVEKLLRCRLRNRKRQWLVKWHGYPDHEATWENEDNLNHVSHWKSLVEEFHKLRLEFTRRRM